MKTNQTSCFKRANKALQENNLHMALELYDEALGVATTNIKLQIIINQKIALNRILTKEKNKENKELISEKIKLLSEAKEIYKNFNINYYLSKNSDVVDSNIDPVIHYCQYGWQEKRDPHPDFSTNDYLTINKDVDQNRVNPFLHWIKYGRKEGRLAKKDAVENQLKPIAKTKLFEKIKKQNKINEKIEIIIPIYNAFDDAKECLDRVHQYTCIEHQIILINDASTDSRIARLCKEFQKKRPNAIVINHKVNQGFIKTVNRGFKETKGHIVLLNTDAFVPQNWIERLMSPIIENEEVATVTPMTNNGEIANVPVICQAHSLAKGVADALDRFAATFNSNQVLAKVPTGVGFCMAISRHWLNKVTDFDTCFGRGYGEEVDWCQRVRELGGKHLLNGNIFVEHRGGMSFGPDKKQLIENNGKIISQRYENYDKEVSDFCTTDPMIGARLALGLLFMSSQNNEVPIYLAHRLGGGAEIWLQQEINEKLQNNKNAVVIREGDIGSHALVELYFDNGTTSGNVHISEISSYIDILKRKEIIYSCLVASKEPFDIFEAILDSIGTKDRLTVLFHDYFPICPSYTLLGATESYCDLPEKSQCEKCYLVIKEKTGNLCDSIEDWRGRWSQIFSKTNQIIVFSNSSQQIVSKAYPQYSNKIKVKPHVMKVLPEKVDVQASDKVIVGVLGSIGFQKGAKVINELAAVAGDKLKIIVIGEMDPKYKHANIHVHGRFDRSEISILAKRYKINRWLIPSIWPETFSYTTHECLATNLPVYCFNLGGQENALKSNSRGILIGINSSPGEILNILCRNLNN